MPLDNEWDLENLIDQLGDANALVAHHASEALVARGPSVVPALLEVFKAGNSSARLQAAYVLVRLKDSQAVEPLLKLLNIHPVGEVRWRAAALLGSLGDKRAVEPLIERLQSDEDDVVRLSAVSSLGQLEDQRAFEPLLQALNDPDWEVRSNAALSLGSLNDERAVEPLIKMLGDKEDEVRAFAASSLGYLGDERALPALEWMAEHDSGATQDGPVKYDAARAIEKIKQRLA